MVGLVRKPGVETPGYSHLVPPGRTELWVRVRAQSPRELSGVWDLARARARGSGGVVGRRGRGAYTSYEVAEVK